jgi:putative oxygen-independent coproporphyrinogen III oxidase
MQNQKLGIYIHFPYCSRRCPYCDFTLTTRKIPQADYTQAILNDLSMKLRDFSPIPSQQEIVSIYLGGGTPSLWDPICIQKVFHQIDQHFTRSPTIEITLEANPEEITWEMAQSWANIGINRVSLGAQSFNDRYLLFLGRQHQAKHIQHAVHLLHQAGIHNINIDLIHGMQEQTPQEALADLQQAIDLSVCHLSLYQLTIEGGTQFGARHRRGETLQLPEDRILEIEDALNLGLQKHGFDRYEVSNASLKGFEAQHNLLYWTFGQYLALGAGAHGLVFRNGEGLRWSNHPDPQSYLKLALANDIAIIKETQTLNTEAMMEEQILVGLRIKKGVAVDQAMMQKYGQRVDLLAQEGLMEIVGHDQDVFWKASPKGWTILDHLTWKLLVGLVFLLPFFACSDQTSTINQNTDRQLSKKDSYAPIDQLDLFIETDARVQAKTDMNSQVMPALDMNSQVMPALDMNSQVMPALDMNSQVMPALDMQIITPNPCGDPSVIPSFQPLFSPVLSPIANRPNHGSDNIYAPDVVRLNPNVCFLYYGAQGSDGHDAIYLATSNDCVHWQNWPRHDLPMPVVDHDLANHVNDPSVVVVNGTWYMYYTEAFVAEDDRIHLATSADGINWQKMGLVLDVGPSGSWDDFKVGRPAVIYENGLFWLYYDGNNRLNRHVGLATSADGIHFQKNPNPLILNAGAVDVERIGDTFVAVFEGHEGTYAQTSADGLQWCERRLIFELTGQGWDAFGQVTPFIFKDQGMFMGLYFGGASDICWCRNRIGLAVRAEFMVGSDPDVGCGGCVANSDCTQACRDGGYGVEGSCAVPGSDRGEACCACFR